MTPPSCCGSKVARGGSALLAATSAAEFHVIAVPVFDD